MREITIGDKEIRVRATPLALLYYKQEFKSDLLGDLIKMQNLNEDMSNLDTIAFLQIAWAMNKADSFGSQFHSFEKWLSGFESVDVTEPRFIKEVLEEAASGFFRGKFKPPV